MDIASVLTHGLTLSIVLVVFGLGLDSSWSDALSLFRHPRLLLRSLLSMNLVMPLVAVVLVLVFDLAAPVKIALVALAISPVPPLLPRKELKAGGDESYAIGLCVAIALLSIVIVPMAVSWLAGAFDRDGEIAAMTVAKAVLASVLVPLAMGIVVRQVFPALAQRVARPLAMLGMVLLVLCVLPLAYAAWPAIHALFGDGTVLILAAMAAIGLGVGHVLGAPHADNRTVLALSTTSRHPAVALAVAGTVASGAESKAALAAIVLYVMVAGIVSMAYLAWRKQQAADTPIAVTARSLK